MKFNPRKTCFIFAALCIPFAASLSASAEEAMVHRMEPDKVYEIDMDQDGAPEEVYYTTWTEETYVKTESDDEEALDSSQGMIELYVDSELFWSAAEEEWSYFWHLSQFALEDGSQYFIASSITDNDYSIQTLLLAADSETLTPIGDLTELTRESDESADYTLSSWSRSGNVASVSGNSFSLNWCDAFMSTGNTIVSIPYTIDGTTVTQNEGPYLLDSEAVWTAWTEILVQASPEDETSVFTVSPNDTVQLTEMIRYNDAFYFKCINEDGQEGWFKDPDHIVSQESEDGTYLMGYFFEAVFAG